MPRITAARAALITFLAVTATIAAAWGFQLVGGYLPCPLCYQQRWPYYAVIPLSLALLVIPGRTGLVRAGLVVVGLVMLAGAGLGAYHAGVEWQWWEGPAACQAGAGFSGTRGVLPDLDTGRVIRCDEAQWRLFGLSFAGYNALISLAIAAVALWGAATGRAKA